jgi:hypothetical protein
MTTRFFRATGLLSALALVLLAGCDSADSGGLAATADLTATITGPTSVLPGAASCTYFLSGGTALSWSNGSGLTKTSSTSTYSVYNVTGSNGTSTYVQAKLVSGGTVSLPVTISSSAMTCP